MNVKRWPTLTTIAALLAILAAAVQPLAAAPKAELWPKWEAHTSNAGTSIDHGVWDRLLSTYVVAGADGVNRVHYGKFSDRDRRALVDYIARLAEVLPNQLSRPVQMAYWINLYNALTVRVVLDHYPVSSILDIDISPGLFSNGPWGRKLIQVAGEWLSLNDIEHRILRPIWRDARIHYAVNCASIGCPSLARQAFVASRLEDMLDGAARSYINNPRGIAFESGLSGSKLYDWYKEDFGRNDEEILLHLKKYAAPPLPQRLAAVRRIDRHHYNWALNDAGTYLKLKMDMEDQRQSR